MKSNIQPSEPVDSISFSDVKIDKFACLFFIMGIMMSAWFLHRFIF